MTTDETEIWSQINPNQDYSADYEMPKKKGNRNDWPFMSRLHNHNFKITLHKLNDLIGESDRNGGLRDALTDMGLEEEVDWVLDEDEQVLYLKDAHFLLIWKMTNGKQFESTIEVVEEHVEKQ